MAAKELEMPIYEYRCGACGHEFELMQKITDRPKRKCEACGRLKARRMISQTSFVLKGQGWYVTDYAGKKAPPSAEADKPASSEKSEKSEKKDKPAKPEKSGKSDKSNLKKTG